MPLVEPAEKNREMYCPSPLLSELYMLGWTRVAHAERSLGEHAHRGYEICYIISGSVDWWSPDGVHEVSRGDIYITRPGEPHGGLDAMMHPCELYWLILEFPAGGRLGGLSIEETRQLRKRLDAVHLRSFPGGASVPQYFARLIDEHRHPGELSSIAARAALHELLICVLRDHDQQAESSHRARQSTADPIARAVARIDADVADNWLVEELAQSVGLSVSHFHDRFVQRVGFSPAEYRNRRRIRLAKQRLRDTDEPVTDLAQRLGFSTSQYFATVFKNLTGLTPRGYREWSRKNRNG